VWWTKLATRQFFYCTLNTQYRIVSYNIWFARWQHPAMWHLALWHAALGSWHWFRQVTAPCNVAPGSGMTCLWICQVTAPCNVARSSWIICHWIRPNVRHIGILLPISISTISPQSTCHSAAVCEILPKLNRPRQKNGVVLIFTFCILVTRGPIMGSLKSPCTTSYRSSIETIALNCLVFEKIAFLHSGDRQTNR